jgi:hypothetical protein
MDNHIMKETYVSIKAAQRITGHCKQQIMYIWYNVYEVRQACTKQGKRMVCIEDVIAYFEKIKKG